MKILITSGPTREPIDGVRFISNLSTGETGKTLAEYFINQGHQVVFLAGHGSAIPRDAENGVLHCLKFETFQDLNVMMQKILAEESFDLIIHAAAVGDYSVKEVRVGEKALIGGKESKIDSSESVQITLNKNFKILDFIKSYASYGEPLVVGFKFTNSKNKDEWWNAVRKIYSRGQVDLVVHNDLSERNSGHDPKFRLVRQNGAVTECSSRLDLARALASDSWDHQPTKKGAGPI